MSESDSDLETMSRNEVIEALETTSEHSGNSNKQLAANRQVLRGIGHQEMKLEDEIAELRESIDSYRTWSRRLTIGLIVLSIILTLLSAAQLYVLFS